MPDLQRDDEQHLAPPIVLGDIHGRLDLLQRAVAAFPGRHFVFLGDLVDRGPHSREVVALVRQLVTAGRSTAVLGNHDQMMVQSVLEGSSAARDCWLSNGGQVTIDSYRGDEQQMLDDAEWLLERPEWHVEFSILFSHAMRPDLTGRDDTTHLWGRPDGHSPMYRLPDGCAASVHGHSIVATAQRLDLSDGPAWFIDTGAFMPNGCLTALDCVDWSVHEFR